MVGMWRWNAGWKEFITVLMEIYVGVQQRKQGTFNLQPVDTL